MVARHAPADAARRLRSHRARARRPALDPGPWKGRTPATRRPPPRQDQRHQNDRADLEEPWIYAQTLYRDNSATLDDLREAVTTLEETERTARRVFGSAHPVVKGIADELRNARAALCARETPSPRTFAPG